MKARSEALRAEELKRGPGGIRDVEFAVQLLQLVHGRHDNGRPLGEHPRGPRPAEPGAATSTPADAEHLATAYRYLRRVEHRLQLRDEQQVYALPRQAAARTRLARVLGYRDRPDASRPRAVRGDPPPPPGVGPLHPRAAVLPPPARRPGRSGAAAGGRGRAAGRLRLPRHRRHPGRGGRADRGHEPQRPPVPGADAPAAAVALGHARPRPRPAAAAHGGRRPGAGLGRGGRPAGLRRGRRAAVPAAGLVEGRGAGPAPPSRGAGRPGRRRAAGRRRRPRRRWSAEAAETLGWRASSPERRAGRAAAVRAAGGAAHRLPGPAGALADRRGGPAS